LITSDLRQESMNTAILRVEQLYPFPAEELREALEGYSRLEEVAWVQEEPANMGAWTFVSPLLEEMLQDRPGLQTLRYYGRPPSPSPAEGSAAWHNINQKEIVKQALAWETVPAKEG
jgi:2-oxoglutarate dehydrogenase complex dehydrogenase (E1) component-like enzyme